MVVEKAKQEASETGSPSPAKALDKKQYCSLGRRIEIIATRKDFKYPGVALLIIALI